MRSIDMTPRYEQEFKEVFSEEGFMELPPKRTWDHTINLKEGNRLLRGRYYLLATKEQEVLRNFVDSNRKEGRIRPINSDYVSPFFF
jgi:hypothetical protein